MNDPRRTRRYFDEDQRPAGVTFDDGERSRRNMPWMRFAGAEWDHSGPATIPSPGNRDPFFNLSRGWYYKAAANGEIKVIHVRQRGALKGVTLVVYDSVCAYFHRASGLATDANAGA